MRFFWRAGEDTVLETVFYELFDKSASFHTYRGSCKSSRYSFIRRLWGIVPVGFQQTKKTSNLDVFLYSVYVHSRQDLEDKDSNKRQITPKAQEQEPASCFAIDPGSFLDPGL